MKLLQIIEKSGNSERDWYDQSDFLYSSQGCRTYTRSVLIDLAISIAQRKRHSELTDLDIVEALLESHDIWVPAFENRSWSDTALHTTYNTLSHITCEYVNSLWVKFDDIRQELGIFSLSAFQNMPVESAPPAARSAILSFLVDHPNYHKNCFLIMSFKGTPAHRMIHNTLKSTLDRHELNLLRADDKSYSDDLMTNIEAYLYGCRFAIAVYERIMSESYNPNVTLEVGYFMGLRKPICLLKEKTLKTLNTDLTGKLYIEFDTQEIDSTIPHQIDKWLRDKAII